MPSSDSETMPLLILIARLVAIYGVIVLIIFFPLGKGSLRRKSTKQRQPNRYGRK